MRKGTFYKTSNGNPITLQQTHEYLERGCMSNPVRRRTECSCCDRSAPVRTDSFLRARVVQGIFAEVAKYTHSRQYL